MEFILINVFFLAVIFISLIILWWVWPPDSPWSPWWRTNRQKAEAACRLAKVSKNDLVYELGSGEANFLIVAAKKFGAKGVGIEIDPLRHLTAKLNIKKNGITDKVALKRKNFFDEDLSTASVIFVYLVPRVLEKLKPKFLKELKKGTKIISYKYKIKEDKKIQLVAKDNKNELFLYKII